MSADNKPNYLYYHTKHGIIAVLTTTIITTTISPPLTVEYTKEGRKIFPNPLGTPTIVERKVIKEAYEDAPRITFAAKIVEQTPINVELHIGVAMTKGKNHFNRKRGRGIAKDRADKCPVLIIYCLTSEIAGVFHEAVKRLTPVIFETKETMCGEPHKENMSLEGILNEQTPD